LYYSDEYAVLGASYTVDAANYGTDYTAVAYMEVKTDDATTHKYCSMTAAQSNVNEVARKALRDLSVTENATYKYDNGNGRFSRYTKEQRARLAALEG
jgi:hypothetical protein